MQVMAIKFMLIVYTKFKIGERLAMEQILIKKRMVMFQLKLLYGNYQRYNDDNFELVNAQLIGFIV